MLVTILHKQAIDQETLAKQRQKDREFFNKVNDNLQEIEVSKKVFQNTKETKIKFNQY